jgi:hypothetical protein
VVRPESPGQAADATLPRPGEVDPLWLEDGLCDVVVEVGHNDDPSVPDRGSAIFLHVAGDDLGPTAGCVALDRDDLLSAAPSRPGPTPVPSRPRPGSPWPP